MTLRKKTVLNSQLETKQQNKICNSKLERKINTVYRTAVLQTLIHYFKENFRSYLIFHSIMMEDNSAMGYTRCNSCRNTFVIFIQWTI